MGAWNSSAVASSPSGAPENPPATKAEFVISAAVEDLGEGLGHCVAGDLAPPGEGVDRAPEPFGVGPNTASTLSCASNTGDCAVHH